MVRLRIVFLSMPQFAFRLALCAALFAIPAAAEEALRRPIAVERLSHGRVVVANRSGSLMIVDLAADKVVGEAQAGQRLSDFKPAVSDQLFLATDEAAHELLAVALEGDLWKVVGRRRVSPYPVSVRVST